MNEHGNVPLHYACFWGQDQVAEVSTQALNSGMGGKKFELEWETLEPSTHPVSTVLCTTFTRFCTASALMLSWECPHHSHLLIPGPCGEWGPCQHLSILVTDADKGPIRHKVLELRDGCDEGIPN